MSAAHIHNAIASVLTFFMLSFFVPFSIAYSVILSNIDNFSPSWQILLCCALIQYCSIKVALITLKNQPDYVNLNFWAFVYVWLGIAPFVQILVQRFPWVNISYYPDHQIIAYLIVWVGVLSYDLGRFFSVIATKKARDSIVNSAHISLNARMNTFLLMIIISLLAISIGVAVLGDWRALFIFRDDARNPANLAWTSLSQPVTLIISSIVRVIPFATLLYGYYIWLWRCGRISSKLKRIFLMLLLFMVFINFVANFPLALARFWLGAIVLSFLLLWGIEKKISLFVFANGIVISLLFGFPAIDYRHSGVPVISFWEHIAETGDYDAFIQITNAVGYVENNGVLWGQNIMAAILFWVPRSLWPSKPFGSGRVIAESSNLEFFNVSMPLWGEAYLAFSWIGVVIIFTLLGYLSRLLDQKIRGDQSSFLILYVFFAGYQIYLLRGDLMSTFAFFIPFFILMIFIRWYEKPTILKVSI